MHTHEAVISINTLTPQSAQVPLLVDSCIPQINTDSYHIN